MYFVKVPQDSKSSGIVAITPENTFCFCSKCGGVFPVNLEDYVGEEDFSLSDPDLHCDQCASVEEIYEQIRRLGHKLIDQLCMKEETGNERD